MISQSGRINFCHSFVQVCAGSDAFLFSLRFFLCAPVCLSLMMQMLFLRCLSFLTVLSFLSDASWYCHNHTIHTATTRALAYFHRFLPHNIHVSSCSATTIVCFLFGCLQSCFLALKRSIPLTFFFCSLLSFFPLRMKSLTTDERRDLFHLQKKCYCFTKKKPSYSGIFCFLSASQCFQ